MSLVRSGSFLPRCTVLHFGHFVLRTQECTATDRPKLGATRGASSYGSHIDDVSRVLLHPQSAYGEQQVALLLKGKKQIIG